jgi:multisubunit Na+/H+ antiporter MnhG subunit
MQELLTKYDLLPIETNLFHSILAKGSLAGMGYFSLLSVIGVVVFYQVYRRKVAAGRV